jgi:predicted RNA-binding protein with PUA-like domain
MNWFLAKTDPDTYSFADLIKDGETLWDGVHSHAAINFIKQMQVGDAVYIYESLSTKAIVGLAEVTGEPFLNTADPRFSWAVKLKYVKTFATPITLASLKAEPSLKDFPLVRIGRLSVMPVEPKYRQWIEAHLN